MTTKRRTLANDPWLKPLPRPQETPEQIGRIERQNHQNLELFADILHDLVREHRGKWVAIHGDRQIRIGDGYQELLDSLPEAERKHALCEMIVPWWTEFC